MRPLLIALAPLLLLSSCVFSYKRIKGNGTINTRDRSPGAFNSVSASGGLVVHLRQDTQPGLRIETDENLQYYIETRVENGILYIEPKDNYHLRPSNQIIVYASAPQYRQVSGSGAVDIIGDNVLRSNEPLTIELSGAGSIEATVSAPSLKADISGSGDMALRGETGDLEAGISGSGSIRAFDLHADRARIDISGAADAEVYAAETLEVAVSGSGDVLYKGAAKVSQSVSGSGSVKKAE